MNAEFQLEEGEKFNRRATDSPIITLVGSQDGGEPYLWIGNNGDTDKACYATLTDRGALRKLAMELLAELEKVRGKV